MKTEKQMMDEYYDCMISPWRTRSLTIEEREKLKIDLSETMGYAFYVLGCKIEELKSAIKKVNPWFFKLCFGIGKFIGRFTK